MAAVVVYAPTARWLVESWLTDRFYSHGPLVAAIALWLAYEQRDAVRAAWRSGDCRPDRRGLPLVVLALLLAMAGAASDVRSLGGISLPLAVTGLLLAAGGPALLRPLAFPIVFLSFAIPLISTGADASGRVMTPMMEWATRATASLTDLFGLHPERSGTIIRYPQWDPLESTCRHASLSIL